ncbi:MAG: acyltransferase family protein, partial [Betaproteobacteria bacterium]
MTSRDAAFDVLRAYAIVHVVLSHAIPYFLPHWPPLAERAIWSVLSLNFGVPLFFVLSGFLITQQ